MAINIQLLLITILLVNQTTCSALHYKRESEQNSDEVSETNSKHDKKSELLEEMFSDDEEIRVLEDLLTELEENLYSDYEQDGKKVGNSIEGVGVTNPPKINKNSEEIHENDEEVGDSTEEIPTATEYFEKDLADDIFDGIEEDLVEIVKEDAAGNSTMILGIAIGCSVSLSCGVAILVLYLVYLRKIQHSGSQPVPTTES